MKLPFKVFFLVLFIYSCENPCDNLDCGINGTCIESTGTCLCNENYEGVNCELEVRDRFIGAWSGTGICSVSAPDEFSINVDITKGAEIRDIVIQSDKLFNNFEIPGSVDDTGSVFVNDIIGPSLDVYVTQFKRIDENSIEITMTAQVPGGLDVCVYTLSR